MKRINESLENYKSLNESRLQLAAEEAKKLNEAASERESFMKNYDIIKSMKARKEATHNTLMEAARDDALAKVIKSVYITALEADTLTDNGVILAESMVDNWIKENGGASKILTAVGEDTYLLSRITQLVEDAAEKEVADIEEPVEDEEEDKEVPDENASKAVQIAQLTAQDAKIKAQIADIKAQKKEEDEAEDAQANPSDDEPKEETPTEDEKKESEDADEDSKDVEVSTDGDEEVNIDIEPENDEKESEAPKTEEDSKEEKSEDKEPATGAADESEGDSDEELDLTIDDGDSESKEEEAEDADADEEENIEEPDDIDADVLAAVDDDDESSDDMDGDDVDDDIDDDGVDDDEQEVDTTIDGDTDNEGEIFDDLDKEEDIQKAIDLIRTRVADAEENFIRNNAEDKKRVDELINKISTNVKAVEDLNDKHETEKEIAQESIRMDKRRIDNIRDNRPLTIFEKMTRNLTSSIVTNESVLPYYTNEEGRLDAGSVVESAKVMYAFLETINTLQLARVDAKYIEDVLNNMK